MAATAGPAGKIVNRTFNLQILALSHLSTQQNLSILPAPAWNALVSYLSRCCGVNIASALGNVTLATRSSALKKLETISLARIEYLRQFFNEMPKPLKDLEKRLPQRPLCAFDPTQIENVMVELRDISKKSVLRTAMEQNQRDLLEISYNLLKEQDDFVVAQAAAFLGDEVVLHRFFSKEQSDTSWRECLKMALKGGKPEIVTFLLDPKQHKYSLESLNNVLAFAIANNLFKGIEPVWELFLGSAQQESDDGYMTSAMLNLLQISMQSGNGELVFRILKWTGWNNTNEGQVQETINNGLADALTKMEDEYCVHLIERLIVEENDDMTQEFLAAVEESKTQSVQALLNRFYEHIDKTKLVQCYLRKPRCIAVQTIIGAKLKMHAGDRDLAIVFVISDGNEDRQISHPTEEIRKALIDNDAERAKTLFAVLPRDLQIQCLKKLVNNFVYNMPFFLSVFQELFQPYRHCSDISQFELCSALAKAVFVNDMTCLEYFEEIFNLRRYYDTSLFIIIKAAIRAKNKEVATRYFELLQTKEAKVRVVFWLLVNMELFRKAEYDDKVRFQWDKDIDYQDAETFDIVKSLFEKVSTDSYTEETKQVVLQQALIRECIPVCDFLTEKGWTRIPEKPSDWQQASDLFAYCVYKKHNNVAQKVFRAAQATKKVTNVPFSLIIFLWLHNDPEAKKILPRTTLNKILSFVATGWLGSFCAKIICWFYGDIKKPADASKLVYNVGINDFETRD